MRPQQRDEFKAMVRRLYRLVERQWSPDQLHVLRQWVVEVNDWEDGPPPWPGIFAPGPPTM